jgi:CBS-domain-containing membrane protein
MPDTVGSILQNKGHQVWSVSPGESVLQAIGLMADKGIGALLVIADEKLVGIISERDYARKVVLQGKSSKDTRVEDDVRCHERIRYFPYRARTTPWTSVRISSPTERIRHSQSSRARR